MASNMWVRDWACPHAIGHHVDGGNFHCTWMKWDCLESVKSRVESMQSYFGSTKAFFFSRVWNPVLRVWKPANPFLCHQDFVLGWVFVNLVCSESILKRIWSITFLELCYAMCPSYTWVSGGYVYLFNWVWLILCLSKVFCIFLPRIFLKRGCIDQNIHFAAHENKKWEFNQNVTWCLGTNGKDFTKDVMWYPKNK